MDYLYYITKLTIFLSSKRKKNNNSQKTHKRNRFVNMDDSARDSNLKSMLNDLVLHTDKKTGFSFVNIPDNSEFFQILINHGCNLVEAKREIFRKSQVCLGTEKSAYKNHIIDDVDDDYQSNSNSDSDSNTNSDNNGYIASLYNNKNLCPVYVTDLLTFLKENSKMYLSQFFISSKLSQPRKLQEHEQWRMGDKFIDKQKRATTVLKINNENETMIVKFDNSEKEAIISRHTEGLLTHCVHLSRSRVEIEKECVLVSISNSKLFWLSEECSKSVGNNTYGSWFAFDEMGSKQLLNPVSIGNCALVINCKKSVLNRHATIPRTQFHLRSPYGHQIKRGDELQSLFGDKKLYRVSMEPIDNVRFYITEAVNITAARYNLCYSREDLFHEFVFWYKPDRIDLSSDEDEHDQQIENEVIDEMKAETIGAITAEGSNTQNTDSQQPKDEYAIIGVGSILTIFHKLLTMIDLMMTSEWLPKLNAAALSPCNIAELKKLNPICDTLIDNNNDNVQLLKNRIINSECELDNIHLLIEAFETGNFEKLHGQTIPVSIDCGFDNNEIQKLVEAKNISNDKLLQAISLYYANFDLYYNFLNLKRSDATLQLQFLFDQYYKSISANPQQISQRDLSVLMMLVHGNRNFSKLNTMKNAYIWSQQTIFLQSIKKDNNNNSNDKDLSEQRGYYILTPYCKYRASIFFSVLFSRQRQFFIGNSFEEISRKIGNISDSNLVQITDKGNYESLFDEFESIFEKLYQFCKHCKLPTINNSFSLVNIEYWRMAWIVRIVLQYIGRCIDYCNDWTPNVPVTFDTIDKFINNQLITAKSENNLQNLQAFIADKSLEHLVIQYEQYLNRKKNEILLPINDDLIRLQVAWEQMYKVWLDENDNIQCMLKTDPFIELDKICNLDFDTMKSKLSTVMKKQLIDVNTLFSRELLGYSDSIINKEISIFIAPTWYAEAVALLLSIEFLHEKIEACQNDKHVVFDLPTLVHSWLLHNMVTPIVVQRKLEFIHQYQKKIDLLSIKIENMDDNNTNPNSTNVKFRTINDGGGFVKIKINGNNNSSSDDSDMSNAVQSTQLNQVNNLNNLDNLNNVTENNNTIDNVNIIESSNKNDIGMKSELNSKINDNANKNKSTSKTIAPTNDNINTNKLSKKTIAKTNDNVNKNNSTSKTIAPTNDNINTNKLSKKTIAKTNDNVNKNNSNSNKIVIKNDHLNKNKSSRKQIANKNQSNTKTNDHLNKTKSNDNVNTNKSSRQTIAKTNDKIKSHSKTITNNTDNIIINNNNNNNNLNVNKIELTDSDTMVTAQILRVDNIAPIVVTNPLPTQQITSTFTMKDLPHLPDLPTIITLPSKLPPTLENDMNDAATKLIKSSKQQFSNSNSNKVVQFVRLGKNYHCKSRGGADGRRVTLKSPNVNYQIRSIRHKSGKDMIFNKEYVYEMHFFVQPKRLEVDHIIPKKDDNGVYPIIVWHPDHMARQEYPSNWLRKDPYYGMFDVSISCIYHKYTCHFFCSCV